MAKNYKFYQYDYKERWISYWHQIDEILKLEPEEILEIGVADKVVSDYLRKQGVAVKTLDINGELNPDFTASVLKMPLPGNSFPVVLCAEVLEHLPFSDFEKALSEIKRVSKRFVVLTLPHFGPAIKFCLKLPFVKEKRFAFKLPFLKKHQSKEHCWEIGKKGYSAGKIRRIIKNHFRIKNEFVPFENQYHHFFILEKYVRD